MSVTIRPARWQFLGNGHRVYNPVLMRFHSPDHLSPFGRGGPNAYAYCAGDPINHADPSGRFMLPLLTMGLGLGLGVAGQAGAFASASPSGSESDSGSLTTWIIGGGIALAGVLGGAAMAGRQGIPKLADSSKGTWANRAGGSASAPTASPAATSSSAWSRSAPATPPRTVTPPRSPSPSPDPSLGSVRQGRDGYVLKRMSELPSVVRERIALIHHHGPHSKDPNPALVGNGKFLDQINNGRLPYDRTGRYFRRFLVRPLDDPDWVRWRIVTGSTKGRGINAVYVTTNHDENYFKVTDWSLWRES